VEKSPKVKEKEKAELSCADGALDAASSSESSELKPPRGISEMMGRETGREVDLDPKLVSVFSWVVGPQSKWPVVLTGQEPLS